MNHEALQAMYTAIEDEVRACPLALLNEGHLETVAAVALLRNGASIVEGSNTGGKKRRISLRDNHLIAELMTDDESRVRTQSGRGRPKGSRSPDLRIILNETTTFRLEIKARCSFGSSRGNPSATLLGDIHKLRDGAVDAALVACDHDVYQNLRGDFAGKRGQKGDTQAKQLFSELLPPVSDLQPDKRVERFLQNEQWHTVTRASETPWGPRIIAVVAKDKPEWALNSNTQRASS
jgi:hypothetical protein